MEGIWISPDKFISLAELEAKSAERQALTSELYTSPFAFDALSWLSLLPDPDPVLRKTGDGIQVLRDLTADHKVLASIQNRKLGTLLKRDYVFDAGCVENEEPTPEAERIAKELRQDLENIDLYNVFSQVLDAPYLGYTPVEIIWQVQGGRYHITDLKPRPQEWFDFNGKHELVWRGDSQPVLEGKIVLARHFPDATNPYGLRLLSRCLWPVAIKKGGVKWWAMLCEKFGLPWIVGKAPSGSGDAERRKIASQLSSMVQDAVAVVSQGTEVDIHGFEAKTGSLHPDLVRYMDSAIALVIMGQTLTAEVGERGSLAAGKVHEDVLDKYTDADETLVCTLMDELAWIYTQLNVRDVLSPTFRYVEPEDYQARADLDGKLHLVGVRFTKAHFERAYNLSKDEFELEQGPAKGTAKGPGEDTELAAPAGGLTPDQQAIDDLAAELVQEAGHALDGNERLIVQAILEAESYEDAIERLLELYPQLSADRLQDLLERGLFAAGAFGRHTADQEGLS